MVHAVIAVPAVPEWSLLFQISDQNKHQPVPHTSEYLNMSSNFAGALKWYSNSTRTGNRVLYVTVMVYCSGSVSRGMVVQPASCLCSIRRRPPACPVGVAGLVWCFEQPEQSVRLYPSSYLVPHQTYFNPPLQRRDSSGQQSPLPKGTKDLPRSFAGRLWSFCRSLRRATNAILECEFSNTVAKDP